MKKIVLVLLFSLIFSVIAAELFLRWFNPVYFCDTISQFQYDRELGAIARPNLRKSILTDHIIEVFTNDIGSRNYLNKGDLLKYKKLVFCVGDSYTEGVGNLTDQSYPFYLDLLLNRNKQSGLYERNFSVINLGLGGYGSIQAYIVSKIYIKKIGRIPDAIIYFICHNDVEDDIRFKSGGAHRWPILGSPYYNSLIVSLNEALENVQLWKRIKLLRRTLLKNSLSDKPIFKKVAGHQNQPAYTQFDPESLPGLIDLANFTKQNNIKLIISYTGYKNTQYDSLKRFAAENNILFADYRPDIEGITAAIPRLPVNNRYSGGHFRSWVNFIVAEKFASILEED